MPERITRAEQRNLYKLYFALEEVANALPKCETLICEDTADKATYFQLWNLTKNVQSYVQVLLGHEK